MCPSVRYVLFVPRGQTFSTHSGGEDKHFPHTGGTNIYVGGGGGGYDVDDHEEEEEDVSEANIVMSEVSKLSAGSQA